MRTALCLLLTGVTLCAAHAADDDILLSQRLLPGRSLLVESSTEAITQIRVLEDRGIVARQAAQGARFPVQLHLVTRQTVRHTTTAAGSDGHYAARMEFLSKTSAIRLPNGEERPVPERQSLVGSVVNAQLDPEGRLKPQTVVVSGGSEESRQLLQPVLSRVLEQVASIPDLRVGRAAFTPQTLRLQIPVAGITTLDLNMDVLYRLVDLKDGEADIEMQYRMTFGAPAAPLGMQATGTGGGRMRYGVAERLTRQHESGTLMTFTLTLPDGTLEMTLNSREKQTTRPSPP